ncbi:hypothetical protein [Brachybacterium tyrofermentans]|uniref:DUF4190 domain-containing protein n=1 Tax=Brachybacterium tyrofermentans TaxID=47848 RepID=A0ABW0FD30_9MICO
MTDPAHAETGRETPDFWSDKNSPSPATDVPAAPVDADQPHRPRRSGRAWIIASLIMNVLAVVGAIVLPHFMAVLAIAAAVCAWNGIRLSRGTGTPKLGIGALIASVVVFVGCVIYTIVIVQLGFAYWEGLQ